MQSLYEMNQAKKKLSDIVDSLSSQKEFWSEAKNRFRFIDRLLIECLGWDRNLIEVEEPDGAGGRIDYELGGAILEAKRESENFTNLPHNNSSNVRGIRALVSSSKALEKAATQVVQYCSLKGTPLAIVCNGPQMMVFQAITPGYPPLDGKCYFFNGLDEYISGFDTLWSILSPEGVSTNWALNNISYDEKHRMPIKASTLITDPFKNRYRSSFQQSLHELSSLLLDEIEENKDLKKSFYKDCYVDIDANKRHLLQSKNIISARYSRISDSGVLPSAIDISDQFPKTSRNSNETASVLGATNSKPILVIGDVGVGKTSFFEYLQENVDKVKRPNTLFIHINLGEDGNLANGIKNYLIKELPSVLHRKYDINIESDLFIKKVYKQELDDFESGVFGKLKEIDEVQYEIKKMNFLFDLISEKDRHLKASISYIERHMNKQVVLIIDNTDQRTFETQQEAFLIAQELASSRNMLVFIALRPSTFFNSKNSGALSGYKNIIYTISPPPADIVVTKRLRFALSIANGKSNVVSLPGIKLDLSNIRALLTATLRSINASKDLRKFLNNVSAGNTRTVLELISGFCGSPNVEAKKIVEIEFDTGRYVVPLHEFEKHALLGEFSYFNSESSSFACNIYDINFADPREHFLKSLIISFLGSNTSYKDKDGYMEGVNLIKEMKSHSFLERQVILAIKVLANMRLIETPYSHFREVEEKDFEKAKNLVFRATTVGNYHIRVWGGAFSFLDATSTDTPIFDENISEIICNRAESFRIQDRLEKAENYKNYLREEWNKATINCIYYDFSALLESQKSTFDKVANTVDNMTWNSN